MASSDADLRRRVQQNTNDIEAIYEILTDHGERLVTIQSTLTDHGQQLSAIKAKLVEHDARFTGIDARFDGIDATLAEILRRLPAA